MRFFLISILFLLYAVPAYAQSRVLTQHEAGMEVWVPPDFRTAEGPWPLIIFSHGFGGCAKQSTFLTAYLADQGYIVAAPDHGDGRPCSSLRAYENVSEFTDKIPEQPFREPQQWSETTYASRRDDILFTLKSMLEDPLYKGYIDEDHIGIAGHSLGGYTALGMAGGWPGWGDKRFKAVLAMSPYANPFIVRKTLKKVEVPVMYMGGTLDNPVTPIIKKVGWAQANAPKYFLELNGGGHSSFTQKDDRYQDLINREALAFFDTYLKGKEAVINPGKNAKGVATYWEDVKKAP